MHRSPVATIESGPGQNATAARRSRSAKVRRNHGLFEGRGNDGTATDVSRPFSANSRSTASLLRGSTANPYNVSVGNATTPPARKHVNRGAQSSFKSGWLR